MPSSSRAFSLIELMTVMALLSVIILGLMAMFTQTQRAFRAGLSQTDVLEAGRVATDLIARDLEQATPNFLSRAYGAPNFYTLLVYDSALPLPGDNPRLARTNIMDDVFFVVRRNQTWTGIGYFVRTNMDGPNAGLGFGPVGTLYRFETNQTVLGQVTNANGLVMGFLNARARTNYPGVSRIVDGVVSFRVLPRDDQGWVTFYNTNWLWNQPFSWPPMLKSTNLLTSVRPPPNLMVALIPPQYTVYQFYSNAVPAAVDFELGILEQQAFERYKSIPVFTAQTNYLASQAGSVHLFRQVVPIRNVDPAAYQ
jgi:prepilin-type N-terminal cleavage/methylation domain-containing protein